MVREIGAEDVNKKYWKVTGNWSEAIESGGEEERRKKGVLCLLQFINNKNN